MAAKPARARHAGRSQACRRAAAPAGLRFELLNPVISRKQVIRDTSDRLRGAGGHHALRSSSDGAAPAPQMNSRCGTDKPGGLFNECSAIATAWEWNCWGRTRSTRTLRCHHPGAVMLPSLWGFSCGAPRIRLRGPEIQKAGCCTSSIGASWNSIYVSCLTVCSAPAATLRACDCHQKVGRPPGYPFYCVGPSGPMWLTVATCLPKSGEAGSAQPQLCQLCFVIA